MSTREELEALVPGAVEHYNDPIYYDWTYRRRRDDVEFYVRMARQHAGKGPVLELGGGSGRVALPLVKAGCEVVLLDASEPMLARAKERAKEELSREERSRLTFVRGDLRTFSFRKKFPLVLSPFNVLLHLYEPDDFARCFRRVRAHLAPKGLFIFDVQVPSPLELTRNPDRKYKGSPFNHPSLGYRVEYTEQFRYDPIKQVQHVTIEFTAAKGTRKKPAPVEVLLSQRQLFPNEVRALLALGGLALAGRYGDFSGRPLGEEDPQQIILARKRPTTAR